MMSLTQRIFIALISGAIIGLTINFLGNPEWIKSYVVNGIFEFGGQAFLSLLKLLVVPLVFVSLVVGTSSLEDTRKLGRLGITTLALYTITTAVALIISLTVGILIEPGSGLQLTTEQKFEPRPAPSILNVFLNVIPTNPFRALMEGDMLQVIFLALFIGISLSLIGNSGKRLVHFFEELNELILKMVSLVIRLAPIGVFCLLAKVFSTIGIEAILPLAKYFFAVLFVLLLHGFVVYGLLIHFLTKQSVKSFFEKISEVWLYAFSTSSSGSTIPVTLKTAIEKFKIPSSIATFTIPLGATINMDGTAIMQGLATVFIAQIYGIDIGWSGYLTVVLTATLASIGTAGVPGVGLITLAMVLQQVGLPVEGIALIIGIDRLLDMVRTAVNVTGDLVVTLIVSQQEAPVNYKDSTS